MYEEIINLPHYRSPNRKPLSMEQRAAQFAPFAALAGYEEAIAEIENIYRKNHNENEKNPD